MSQIKISGLLIQSLAFILASLLSVGAATLTANLIEDRSIDGLQEAMPSPEMDFVQVEADGLLVTISGVAPDEATRFKALSIAGGLVAPERLIDRMDVADTTGLAPLRFSIEILRNEDGVSLIGLIPTATGRARVLDGIAALAGGAPVTDMLETADMPVPDGWNAALAFALRALQELPRSKISVAADVVSVAALTESPAEKARVETMLSRSKPDSMRLVMDIAAPRPAITPFTLRFSITGDGTSFDACSADTDAARDRILAAATAAGLQGKASCTVGLGVPSPRWSDAVVTAIEALAELGGGSITFSDADVSLVGLEGQSKAEFDRIAGELEADLPDLFSLHAVLPISATAGNRTGQAEAPQFTATLSPEGLVQLRGKLADETQRNAVNSYAQSLFGTDDVYSATRLDPLLPDSWPVRVLAGLEAMGQLSNGVLVVQPGFLELRGVTGASEANAEVARILSSKLGQAEDFRLAIRYDEKLDPAKALPTAEECVAALNAVQAGDKITFDSGSTQIAEAGAALLDTVADILRGCSTARIEIAAFTDSQGREELNLRISQARADAVLASLLERRVLTSNLIARGYGEADPIADNATEAGREANRRIEFRVASPEPEADAEATSEDTPQEAPAEAPAGPGADQ